MQKLIFLTTLFSILCLGCKSDKLPSERFSQFSMQKPHTYENNVLKFEFKNSLNYPLRIWMKNSNEKLQAKFNELNPIVLQAKSNTLISLSNIKNFNNNISYTAWLGSTSKKIEPIKIELPFPMNREYKVIQGNNTAYTHSSEWSRYAVDFNLKVNDTINSATSGFVVGVIDDYKNGGKGDKWKPFGNFITIYHPNSGIFTQYVHLVFKGSLVKVGDTIKRGQPIALSGKTGQTSIEHLHFNCLIPTNNSDGLKSIPFEFIEGYKSEELKRNDVVKK